MVRTRKELKTLGIDELAAQVVKLEGDLENKTKQYEFANQERARLKSSFDSSQSTLSDTRRDIDEEVNQRIAEGMAKHVCPVVPDNTAELTNLRKERDARPNITPQELQDLQNELATKATFVDPTDYVEKATHDRVISDLQAQLAASKDLIDPSELTKVIIAKEVVEQELNKLKEQDYPTQLTDLQTKLKDSENELTAKNEDIANNYTKNSDLKVNYVEKAKYDTELKTAKETKVNAEEASRLANDAKEKVEKELFDLGQDLTDNYFKKDDLANQAKAAG